MDPTDVRDLTSLAARLTDSDDVEETLDELVAFAVRAVHVDHGGITLLSKRRREFQSFAPTDPQVEQVDRWQHELREGPCVAAAVEGRAVHSNDLARDPRWPRWGPRAASLGFERVLSAELHAKKQRVGALNLYRDGKDPFGPDDLELARLFARHAAAAVVRIRTEGGLKEALGTRTSIAQAQGMLMERFGFDGDTAFGVLRRYSQDNNVRLRDVAQQVVEHRGLPDSGSPPHDPSDDA